MPEESTESGVTEQGGDAQSAELREKAKTFIKEYQRFGFYRNLSPGEEEEAIANIVAHVVEDKGWPLDWWLVQDDKNTYWFDGEWMGDLEHMYSEFLIDLSKITKGDIVFENFSEFVNLEEHEGASWVEFDWMGGRHHIDAKGMGDWIDYPSLVSYLNEELRKTGNPRRFFHPFSMDDQTAILAFLKPEELKALQTEKGWPEDTDNSFLFSPVKKQPARQSPEKRSLSLKSIFRKK